jgi:hypothetical protein
VEDLIAFWISCRVLLAKLQGLVVFLFLSGSLLVICAPTVLMAAISGASAPFTVQKKKHAIIRSSEISTIFARCHAQGS